MPKGTVEKGPTIFREQSSRESSIQRRCAVGSGRSPETFGGNSCVASGIVALRCEENVVSRVGEADGLRGTGQ